MGSDLPSPQATRTNPMIITTSNVFGALIPVLQKCRFPSVSQIYLPEGGGRSYRCTNMATAAY